MRTIAELDGETRVVGVIGWPVRHSLSPAMQNAAIAQMGLNWIYVPFQVSPMRLAEALEGMKAMDIVGLNVTVPHKEQVAGLVDELGETAGALGAVNTIRNKDGVLFGYNTDGEGFLRALREAGEQLQDRRVVMIGAGGSARAIAYAVTRNSAGSLTLVNRTLDRAVEVANLVRDRLGVEVEAIGLDSPEAEAAVREADVVIDATPTGMHPHADDPPVVPGEWFSAGQLVCDLVYTPRNTSLMKAAAEKGARTLNGTGMLVHQGALALELWTGQPAPHETMHEALLAALESRESRDGA